MSVILFLFIGQPTLTASNRTVTHDVPVNVIPRRLWDEFEEPEMPDFDVSLTNNFLYAVIFLATIIDGAYFQVSIYMPPLRVMRNVVDRMKNLSNFLTISANNSGQLTLSINTDIATITTHFKDLEHPPWSELHMAHI